MLSDTGEDKVGDSFDIKIDAVFSLTDDSSEKNNTSNDSVSQSDQENTSRDIAREKDNDSSPSVKSNSSVKQSSPATKSCHVVLKKIAHAQEAISLPQLNKLDNISDEKSRMASRPSRKRKPSALLASESYVKSFAEFRNQITTSKMLQKQSQNNLKPEVKTKEDVDEFKDALEKHIDDSQSEIFSKKNSKKRQTLRRNKNKKDLEKTNEIKRESEKSDKKKNKRKAPKYEATETDNNIAEFQNEEIKVRKIKQELNVFESDCEFTLSPIQVSPEITVQNVAEFPKETKMKSLLSPVLSQNINAPEKDTEIDPKQDYLKELSSANFKQGRVPCSLNGRCIKPNNRYLEGYLTDFSKKDKTKKDNSETVKIRNDNSTLVNKNPKSPGIEVHQGVPYPGILVQNIAQMSTASQNKPFLPSILTSEETKITTPKNVYHIPQSQSGLPQHRTVNPTTSSDSNTNVAAQNPTITGIVSKLFGKTAQNDVAKPTGTTLVSEGTKKFFHLQVGEKVVLIPTDGNVVIPKAYVMDIKQSEEFQSRLAAKKLGSDPPVKIKYRSATTRADGKPEVSATVPPCINTAVSLLANSVSTKNRVISSNSVFSPMINEVGLYSSECNQSTQDDTRNDYSYDIKEKTNDALTDTVKIKTEPIDEDYNDQGQQVFTEIRRRPGPELSETEQKQSEQNKQKLGQDIPEIKQEAENDDSMDNELPSVKACNNTPSSTEISPPILTRVESFLPTCQDDSLNSPPLLSKSCSFDEPEKEIPGENGAKDNVGKSIKDNGGKIKDVNSDVEVLIPETEVDMRIRKLKEQLRQKQQELEKFKMSFGGGKQKL